MATIKFMHTVLFWLKNPESSEDKTAFKSSLEKFISNSKFIESSFIGTPPKKERAVIDDSFTFSLSVGFQSKKQHDAYQIEDVHTTFIEESSQLWDRVLIYDSEA
ncbi:Dabb family protein [Flavicella sediminum]|uniref:Dabb family protein n=1 Tax=Flavicella sediminum TaxID=2585141 RepID=UPI0011211114|nr:Dabb family protein [Flavicella sediminum]